MVKKYVKGPSVVQRLDIANIVQHPHFEGERRDPGQVSGLEWGQVRTKSWSFRLMGEASV